MQSNLFVMDMLYNGHLVIADIFLRGWPNLQWLKEYGTNSSFHVE